MIYLSKNIYLIKIINLSNTNNKFMNKNNKFVKSKS